MSKILLNQLFSINHKVIKFESLNWCLSIAGFLLVITVGILARPQISQATAYCWETV